MSRQGKKAIAFYADPEVSKELRLAALDRGMTLQAVMEECVSDWFTKEGIWRVRTARSARPASSAASPATRKHAP